jgi:hypothetical protein
LLSDCKAGTPILRRGGQPRPRPRRPGWKQNSRIAHWPDVKTLGDVATEALRRAKWQVVTPLVVDLPQLYGASIS